MKLFSFCFIWILAGCGNAVSRNEISSPPTVIAEQTQPPTAAQNQPRADPQLTVRMERFTWTRTLLYKVEIQPDGKAFFTKTDGKFVGTKITGKAESKLEKEKMRRLLAEIEAADFSSLDDAYSYTHKNCASAMTDTDSVKVYIKLNEREKTIDHDLGCFDVSFAELKEETNRKDRIHPRKLYELENRIDEITETRRWTGENR
ncbi:MAG TPA: DUF6438 domain-containing protein [Pyrinomonadaceae bacterium]